MLQISLDPAIFPNLMGQKMARARKSCNKKINHEKEILKAIQTVVAIAYVNFSKIF